MPAPKIGVVVPTHDCGPFLQGAIDSVLSQTVEDFELIVVDDGSSDETEALLARCADPRIRVLRNDRPLGPSAARNRGILASSAPIIAFLDADDRWDTRALGVHLEALRDPKIGVSCVAAISVGTSGETVVQKSPPYTGPELTRELLFTNTIPGSSSGIAIRQCCFERVGLFDEGLLAAEDRDMWLRLSQEFDFRFDAEALTILERRRWNSAIRDVLRMAEGHQRFLERREVDLRAEFRPLLPRLRRSTFLRVAAAHRAVGRLRSCRQYSIRAVLSSNRIDRDLARAVSLLVRSFWLPAAGVREELSTGPTGSVRAGAGPE